MHSSDHIQIALKLVSFYFGLLLSAAEYPNEYSCNNQEYDSSNRNPNPDTLKLTKSWLWFNVAFLIKESLICKRIQVVAKNACLKVSSSTNDIVWITLLIWFNDLTEVDFKRTRCCIFKVIRKIDLRLEPCIVWKIFEISEIKSHKHFFVIKHAERCFMILRDIWERFVFGLFYDISILISDLFSFNCY